MIIEEALNEITNIPNINTDRYYNDDGIPVPRVTEILSSMMHSDALMYWANNLGFKGIKYKTALNSAANIGTEAHNTIEAFLRGKLSVMETDNIPFKGFFLWYNNLVQLGYDIEIVGIEVKLTCKWFGGTYDMLIRINNKLYLVDFKTSNYVTEKYFMQLAAYRYMLLLKGININGVIVLQLDKKEPGFNEYILEFSIQEHLVFIENCTRAFLSLVYAYYNVQIVQNQYKSLSKRMGRNNV